MMPQIVQNLRLEIKKAINYKFMAFLCALTGALIKKIMNHFLQPKSG